MSNWSALRTRGCVAGLQGLDTRGEGGNGFVRRLQPTAGRSCEIAAVLLRQPSSITGELGLAFVFARLGQTDGLLDRPKRPVILAQDEPGIHAPAQAHPVEEASAG